LEIDEAVRLISCNEIQSDQSGVWMDLGCGSGTFTYALANLLGDESQILAVDKTAPELKSRYGNVHIKSMELDFVHAPLPLREADGILMANAIHFVKDKLPLIEKLRKCFRHQGLFLIVEYDLIQPIQTWVPYPLGFDALGELFSDAGYTHIRKLNQHPSRYNQSMMYSAVIY